MRTSPSGSCQRPWPGTKRISLVRACWARVLLTAAGLFVRSLALAERADLGFRPQGVLNVHMDVGQVGYTEAQGRAFFRTGKYGFLFEDPQPFFYVPLSREYTALRLLHVRTSAAPEALTQAVVHSIRALEPDPPLYDVQTMERALGSGLGLFPVRVAAAAAATFGLLAFALAMVGLYAVVSYLSSQRRREIGVRVALGATRNDIVRLFSHDVLRPFVGGLVAGALVTLASSPVLGRLLFGFRRRRADAR